MEVRCPLFVLPEPSAHWTILGCRHLCACYWRADLAWPYLVFQRPHQQVCWKKVRRKQGGPFLGHDCPGLPPLFSEACPKRKDKCLQPSWGPSGSISMDTAKCLGVAGPDLKFALSKRKQDSWGTELCLRRRGKQKDMVSQVLGTMERYWGQKSRSWTSRSEVSTGWGVGQLTSLERATVQTASTRWQKLKNRPVHWSNQTWQVYKPIWNMFHWDTFLYYACYIHSRDQKKKKSSKHL